MANNGGDHGRRIGKPQEARKEMEDTVVVMAHPEFKTAARIKEHAQSHAGSIAEFDHNLNALITIVGRMQGGIESNP